MWDERYSAEEYVYGTEPNDFLKSAAGRIPPDGSVLALADGEGRNGVFLAGRGHAVLSVDGSAVGLQKAERLAAARGVAIRTLQADLTHYSVAPNQWDAVVSIFCHLPSATRKRLHREIAEGLRPGGVFILEAYTPAQLELKTGGPSDPDFLMTAEGLRAELKGLDLVHAAEIRREIHEGAFHSGLSAAVQIIGIKN